jgi:glycosyltransferase involved in cell wall biosynthesis
LKILITVGIYPPDIGGPASFVPKIANLLSQNNYEVTVICLSDSNLQDNETYKVKRILRNQNLLIRWLKTIILIILNGRNAECIFVNGLPMESYIANIFLRKKIVRKIVGDWAWERGRNKGLIEDSFDEFQLNSHNLHLEIAKFSRGWTATKADIVITPSRHLSNVVKNWGVKADKLKVIYNGTRITNNEFSKSNSNIIKLITVGRLAPWKNVNTIIEAVHLLKNQDLKINLIIVGSGPEDLDLKKQVNNLNLTNEVIFTGQKKYSDLKEYYKSADIYIQASGYEGLPHVLLEAINFDLAIISTPIGGTNEILQDGKNGFILDLEKGIKPNSENLKNIILEVVNNKKLTEEKKVNAKKLLNSKFDESKNLYEYLEILNK